MVFTPGLYSKSHGVVNGGVREEVLFLHLRSGALAFMLAAILVGIKD